MVLNGGGLGQVQDITEAFSPPRFGGREQDLRSLIAQLGKFTAHLNDQTGDIIAATDSLNSLVGKFAVQQPVLDRALATVPDALAVLNSERDNLVQAADQLGKFSALAVDTVNQTKENLVKESEANRTGVGVAGQRRSQPDASSEPASPLSRFRMKPSKTSNAVTTPT